MATFLEQWWDTRTFYIELDTYKDQGSFWTNLLQFEIFNIILNNVSESENIQKS